jgi:hypothetical protein
MLPVQVTWRNQLVLTVLLDGKPVSALVDSGSSLNLLQPGAARRVGATTLTADPIEYVRGIDGSVIAVRLHTFLTMDIGASHCSLNWHRRVAVPAPGDDSRKGLFA